MSNDQHARSTPRRLRSYRPQHDEDCKANICAECNRPSNPALGHHACRCPERHDFVAKPCSCGLDAALSLDASQSISVEQATERVLRAMCWLDNVTYEQASLDVEALIAAVRHDASRGHRIELTEQEHHAGLIHQPIPDVEGTEPRPIDYKDNGFIGNSFRVLIDDLNRQAFRARRRFKIDGELWRIYQHGVEYYASAIDDSVRLLERRLQMMVGSPPDAAPRPQEKNSSAALLPADPSVSVKTEALPNATIVAELFHQHYEQLAPHFGYSTRPESQVPWARLPEANRLLMVRTVECVLHDLRMPWIASRVDWAEWDDDTRAEFLDDAAIALFGDLCEGDGEHTEALDHALIKKHLQSVIATVIGSGTQSSEAERAVERAGAQRQDHTLQSDPSLPVPPPQETP